MAALDWGMILGGFGLFMFGIRAMGDGLKAVAGDQLRDYIQKYTSNKFSAVFIGIVITIIMQSSSATSAITIGLVRAGLMTFEESVGIILGATIGTTFTSFLISINVEKYAMFIVFIGTMLICFAKKQKFIYIGDVIMGFGLIFFGMASMGDSLAALKDLPQFEAIALQMSENPLLAMFAGILLTAAVQSSAATIGVIQKLYDAGAVTFSASLPFMFGANVGTTVTGIIASIGGTLSGKRTAALHTTINVISTILGMLLLVPFSNFILRIAGGANPMMQIAIANIVFKVITTMLFLPFTNQLVAFVKKIVPGEEPSRLEVNVDEMDTEIADLLPSAAVNAAQQAIMKMVDLVRLNIMNSRSFLTDKLTSQDRDKFDQTEGLIDHVDYKITNYLTRLNTRDALTKEDTYDIRCYFDTVKNYERIGDLAVNLVEFYTMVNEANQEFTDMAKKEILDMYDVLIDMIDNSAEILVTKSKKTFKTMYLLEKEIDALEEEGREMHFKRMSEGICTSPIAESIYCDVLGTLERMGDHAYNIAKSPFRGEIVDVSDVSDETMKLEL